MAIKGRDIVNENEYWLISNDAVETIRKNLKDIISNEESDTLERSKDVMMYLDTGLHKCGVKPYDM